MSKIRTFIAAPLPEEVVNRVAQLCRQIGEIGTGIRWVEPQNMHLTLKFLGDVDENETYRICQSLQQAAGGHHAFQYECQGAGAFPKVERPRTLWVGVGQGRDEIIALQADIDGAMADLGYAPDPKRYLPHLTIGRVKKPGRWLADVSRLICENADFHAGTAPLDEVILYSSELTPEGPIYAPIGRSSLQS